MPADELSLFALWETFLRDLLARTQKFPKRVRFTLSSRLENLALDVVERLVEARYSRQKFGALQAVSIDIEKLRVLARICHDEGHLDHHGFEHVARSLDEAGRMGGGWLKQQAQL